MTLHHDVMAAVLDTQDGRTAINQDYSLTACTWRDYYGSRTTCTDILVRTAGAQGARYRCRQGFNERALLLVERGRPPQIDVEDTGSLARVGWALDLVVESLYTDFGVVIDHP